MKDMVLFVDDEIRILKALKRSFKNVELNTVFVESGKSALEILKVNDVKVIVVDIGLLDMDGKELLHIVEEKYPTIAKIALTGINDLDEVVGIFDQANLYKYITKPWDNEQLIQYIYEALNNDKK